MNSALPNLPRLEILERRQLLAAFAHISAHGTLFVLGTSGADSIQISASDDSSQIVAALNGSSLMFDGSAVLRVSIDAEGGNDSVVLLASRRSTIVGGDGNDNIVGGPSNDILDGGGGDDTINGEGRNDTLTGGDGNDIVEYGDRARGFTFIFATLGRFDPTQPLATTATNEEEADSLTDYFETIGGSGKADVFVPNSMSSEQNPPTSDATLVLAGRAGDDRFERGPDLDDIPIEYGGKGNDYFVHGLERNAQYFGGAGDDTYEISDLTVGSFDGGSDNDSIIDQNLGEQGGVIDLNDFQSVENCTVRQGTIHVIGTAGPNRLEILFGGGTILGGGGNDTIVGSDFVDGGAGDDTIEGGGTILGGEGDDTIVGGGTILGGEGNDTIVGGPGGDAIYGGDGNDVLSGAGGNDKIHGDAGNDTLNGGKGKDRLYGDDGDDFIYSRDKRRDTLFGGDGNDTAKADDTPEVKDLIDGIETLLP